MRREPKASASRAPTRKGRAGFARAAFLKRRLRDGSHEAVEIMGTGLSNDLDAGGPGGPRGLGTDRDDGQVEPERGERLRRRSRGEHHELTLGQRDGSESRRTVERDDVGAELLREERSGPLGSGEEHATG